MAKGFVQANDKQSKEVKKIICVLIEDVLIAIPDIINEVVKSILKIELARDLDSG